MRFTVTEIRHYYNNLELFEALWWWSRKHYRLETLGGHWVRLNKREDRISVQKARADETTSSQMSDYPAVVDC